MLITVWVFIGIEGANVFSARAQCREDNGRATLLGFAVVLLLMAVSLLSLGIAAVISSLDRIDQMALGKAGTRVTSVSALIRKGRGASTAPDSADPSVTSGGAAASAISFDHGDVERRGK
jgi:amino acid transporter